MNIYIHVHDANIRTPKHPRTHTDIYAYILIKYERINESHLFRQITSKQKLECSYKQSA